MSFYASQVGKKSSRYCNSSLYGTNLSSVYADGPPPLDDSTQDEDEDEMVFRDPSPNIKSKKDHETKGGETSNQSDFQPWSNDDSNEQSASGNDFGDFSSFADFSSAFGSHNESKTNQSSWFKSNGDCNQSSGTLNNEKEVKSQDFSNSDEEFGCFSGGDESDFDDFKGFSNVNQNKNTNKTKENEKSLNGLETGNILSEGINENNVKKSDFFSDDDDEYDDFQSSNQIDSSIQETNSNASQSISNSIKSRTIPPIFSDDDEDEDFGEFSSSSGDNVVSSPHKDKAVHRDPGDTPNKDIDSSNLISKTDNSSISTIASKEEMNISQQKNEDSEKFTSQKTENCEKFTSQKSSIDENESEPLSIEIDQSKQQVLDIREDKKHTESKDKSLSESNSSDCQPIKDVINDPSLSNQSTSPGASQKKICDDNGSSNLEVKTSVPAQDDDDFGDFSKVLESDTGENSGGNDSFEKLEINSSKLPSKDHDDGGDDFGDFSSIPESNTQNNTNNEDNFGDFSAVSLHNDQTEKKNDTLDNTATNTTTDQEDDDFADFAEAQPSNQSNDKFTSVSNNISENEINKDMKSCSTISQLGGVDTVNDDDDFGDFAEVSSMNNNEDDFGDFSTVSTTPKNDNTQNINDTPDTTPDNFGAFAASSTNSRTKDNQDSDNFGQFATFPPTKPIINDDDDFDDFGEFSSDKPHDDADDFGDFSSVSQPNIKNEPSNKEFSDFKSESKFANFDSSSATTDKFGDFSSSFQTPASSVKSTTPSTTTWSKSMVQSKESQIGKNQSNTQMTTIFKPQKNTSISKMCNTFEQSFVSVELNVQKHTIVVLLENEIQAGTSSIWQSIKTSERDGSLRFEWMTSDHQLTMLEAVSMLPVRIQTSASFKSSGPVQTPLFASGLGLLEPVKGVITPFHHGVEEINPSQDPFGAPPEVGVRDLGFVAGAGKKDTQAGQSEVKDNMDSISVSSSLDLDFLAPSNGNGDSTKTESRGLFEDDLLGLGMQFSSTNDSPKVFSDQKKVFKFNTTAILHDDTNLSVPAKKIVTDFEDLSFMLSKALMFPLKSKE